jgi:hypothetical protein
MQLRRALDDQGLVEMSARQALVVRLVGRPVDSLRNLESHEARAILERLAAPDGDSGRTAWDDREEIPGLIGSDQRNPAADAGHSLRPMRRFDRMQ